MPSMKNTDQLVDSIIAEEKLDVPQGAEDNQDEGAKSDDADSQEDKKVTSDEGEQTEDQETEDQQGDSEDSEDKKDDTDDGDAAERADEQEDTDKKAEKEEKDTEKTASDIVDESKSLIGRLTANGLKTFDDKGNVRPFEEVLPAGPYLASNLEPVKVVDKEGKTHEFLLISDVEKAFPDGFEAKNNIEQMKFERGIMANENKFDAAVSNYNQAKQTYEQEVGQIEQAQASQSNYAKEYRAMAEDGLVPKVGDPNDPKFKESDAVKELNSILSWMESKNAELTKKGLGTISSLYVAKQLMDKESGVDKKQEKVKEIDKERKSVASLSRTPQSGGTEKEAKKKAPLPSNMAHFAEQLISEEGLA